MEAFHHLSGRGLPLKDGQRLAVTPGDAARMIRNLAKRVRAHDLAPEQTLTALNHPRSGKYKRARQKANSYQLVEIGVPTAGTRDKMNHSQAPKTMTSKSYNRREFLGRTILSGTGAALAMSSLSWAAEAPVGKPAKLSTPKAEQLGWRLCCQLYTFRDRSFYEALDTVAALGVCRVEPAYFLPLSQERKDLKTGETLSPDQRREMKQRMRDMGITMPNYYGPVDADKATYRKTFDFAKEMGVETIVAEPPTDMLETLDGLCQEYKINLAVHNHPEGPGSKYWNPDTLLNACAGRSARIGACPDTGHWVRSGLDTMDSLRKYQKRIITLHLKDAAESGKRDSRDVPLGTGRAGFTAILKQLHDWKWRGVMTIEYEHQSPQLVQEVAQCVKFVEDYAASVKA